MLRKIIHTFVYSLVAGMFLGFLLKWLQHVTGYKVYTLLMNVDYIPILKEYTFPVWIEFTFHLIIAVILAYAIVWVAWKRHFTREQLISFTILMNSIIAIMLYPTTALSNRTPPLFPYHHLVYGF